MREEGIRKPCAWSLGKTFKVNCVESFGREGEQPKENRSRAHRLEHGERQTRRKLGGRDTENIPWRLPHDEGSEVAAAAAVGAGAAEPRRHARLENFRPQAAARKQ